MGVVGVVGALSCSAPPRRRLPLCAFAARPPFAPLALLPPAPLPPQDGAKSVQDGATQMVRGLYEMVRDRYEMLRDRCQMLRDRYEMLRRSVRDGARWYEMLQDRYEMV